MSRLKVKKKYHPPGQCGTKKKRRRRTIICGWPNEPEGKTQSVTSACRPSKQQIYRQGIPLKGRKNIKNMNSIAIEGNERKEDHWLHRRRVVVEKQNKKESLHATKKMDGKRLEKVRQRKPAHACSG